MQVITGMAARPVWIGYLCLPIPPLRGKVHNRPPELRGQSGMELATLCRHVAKARLRMSDPLLPTLSLFAALSAAHHAAQRLIEARLPKGLNAPQFTVLERLAWQGEGQTPASIAESFGWPKTTMSHTVTVLETRALVRLEPNPRDGRSKCLWLTPKGRSLALSGRAAVEADLAAIAALTRSTSLEALTTDLHSLAARLSDLRRFPDAA
jgi:DNA-binding MarR family transcriptional regulator